MLFILPQAQRLGVFFLPIKHFFLKFPPQGKQKVMIDEALSYIWPDCGYKILLDTTNIENVLDESIAIGLEQG